jgi:hypothetical protein
MGTITIPSYSEENMRRICSQWHTLVKRFYESIQRRHKRETRVFDYVSVTEIQPGRWSERGECGLHLHFIYPAFRFRNGEWNLPDNWIRQRWQSLIQNLLEEGTVSRSPNYRREAVSTSSAGYLAKYLSKGGEVVQEVIDTLGEDFIPHRWYSMNVRLRYCILRNIRTFTGDKAGMVASLCEIGDTALIRYSYEVTLDKGVYSDAQGTEHRLVYHLGIVGGLTSQGLKFLGLPVTPNVALLS